MNNKILIEVIVPFLESSYEVYIPINRRISSVIKLMEKALKELTNGYYPDKEGAVIIDEKTGNVYDINITVKDSRMMNGTKVILI
jgi:hypothetical protein